MPKDTFSHGASYVKFEFCSKLLWNVIVIAFDVQYSYCGSRPTRNQFLEFDLRRVRQHYFVEIDQEIFSSVILSIPLIQEVF